MTLHNFSDDDDHPAWSYATDTEADRALGFDPIRRTAWAALDDDAKARSLIAATQRLDLLRWRGERVDKNRETQTTEWPRSGLTYADGSDVPASGVPSNLERACILLAGTIAATPATADEGQSAQPIRRVRAGSAEVEFRSGRARARRPIQDETAYALISQWLLGGGILAGEAYGTDETTAFDDDYERERGFA